MRTFHVKQLLGVFAGILLASACSAVCLETDVGEWAFTRGQWVHCDSWVAACELQRDQGDCETDARDMGCKL